MPAGETDPVLKPDLEAYRFHEVGWDDYEELRDAFEWAVPEAFNAATYACDRWAEAVPDRVSLVAVEPDGAIREHTFSDLRGGASRLADFLADRGVGRGDRVAVSGTQRVEAILTLIAAWKLGAVTVPLSVRFGPEGLGYRLEDSGASAIVADPACLPALREVAPGCEALETVLVVGDASPAGDEVAFESATDDRSSVVETATTAPEEPAAIMYTSGTTGPPKGVVHPHRSLLGALPSHVLQIRDLTVGPDDLVYTPAEWSWFGPLYQGVLPSLYYGTPVLADADPQFDPEAVFEFVDRYGVTAIGGATTVYRMMMQVPGAAERYDLSSLRVVMGGGEALGETVVEWWRETVEGVAVHESYGQTESGFVAGDCEALGVEHEPAEMGEPLPGVEVRVVDPGTDEPVERGEVGEIVVRSDGNPGCFTGYWNRPETTAEAVRNGWLYTGDLGSVSPVGYLAFHSRADDVIVSSGYRIGPAGVEECLAEHDAVAGAGVIGVPDDTRGEVPKAFVVPVEGFEPTDALAEELQAHVRGRLAKHEYPRELEFLEELPLTSTGKVRRRDLRVREGVADDRTAPGGGP